VIVADTNLISYVLIDGEKTDLARKVWTIDPDWAMPPLWRSEFLSVLVVAVRAGALKEEQAQILLRRSHVFMSAVELEPDGERVFKLAVERNISAYDAQFVAVAEELEAPLVTADKRIIANCPDLAVSLETFVSNNYRE
jgi:predicted nucleic acid-binding protein